MVHILIKGVINICNWGGALFAWETCKTLGNKCETTCRFDKTCRFYINDMVITNIQRLNHTNLQKYGPKVQENWILLLKHKQWSFIAILDKFTCSSESYLPQTPQIDNNLIVSRHKEKRLANNLEKVANHPNSKLSEFWSYSGPGRPPLLRRSSSKTGSWSTSVLLSRGNWLRRSRRSNKTYSWRICHHPRKLLWNIQKLHRAAPRKWQSAERDYMTFG